MARAIPSGAGRCCRSFCLLVLLSLCRLPSSAHGGSLGVAVEKEAPDDVLVTISVLGQSQRVVLNSSTSHATHTWPRNVKPQDDIRVHVHKASTSSQEGSMVGAHVSPSRLWTVAFPSSNTTLSLNLDYIPYNPCANTSLSLCAGECIFSGNDNNYTCAPATAPSTDAAGAATTLPADTLELSTVPFEYERTVEEQPRLETQTVVIVGFTSILFAVPMVAVFLLLRSRKLDKDAARRRRRNTSESRGSGDPGFRQRRNAVSGHIELTPPPMRRKPGRTLRGGIFTPLMPGHTRGPVSEDGGSDGSHHRPSPLSSGATGPLTSTGRRGHGSAAADGGDGGEADVGAGAGEGRDGGRQHPRENGSVSGIREALLLMDDESPPGSPTSTNVDFDLVNSPPPRPVPDTAVHSPSSGSGSGGAGQRRSDTTGREMNTRSPRIVADDEEAQREWDSEEEEERIHHAAVASSSSLLSPVPALASRRRVALSTSSNNSPALAAPNLALRPPSPGDPQTLSSSSTGTGGATGAKQDASAVLGLRNALAASLRGGVKASTDGHGSGFTRGARGGGAAGGPDEDAPLRHNSCASTSSPPPVRAKSAARAARDRVLARLRAKAAQKAASTGTSHGGGGGSTNTRDQRSGSRGNGGPIIINNDSNPALSHTQQQQQQQQQQNRDLRDMPATSSLSNSNESLQGACGSTHGSGGALSGDKLTPRVGRHRSPQKKSRHDGRREAAAAAVGEAANKIERCSSSSPTPSSPLSGSSASGVPSRAVRHSPTAAGPAASTVDDGARRTTHNRTKERGADAGATVKTGTAAANTANRSWFDDAPQEGAEAQSIRDRLSRSPSLVNERVRAASDPVSPRHKSQQRSEKARSRAHRTPGNDLKQRLLQDSFGSASSDTNSGGETHQRLQSPVGTVFRCEDAGVRLVIEEPSEAVLRTSSMLSDYRRATMDKKTSPAQRRPQRDGSTGSGSEIDL